MRRYALLMALAAVALAAAAPTCPPESLVANGLNLPLPPPPRLVAPNVTYPTYGSVPLTATDFTGTWAAPAKAAWHGTIAGTGSFPDNQRSGTAVYNFAGLAAGALPAGSLFHFGDVDGGSATSEFFTLTATGRDGAAITAPWLGSTEYAWGAGRAAGGGPDAADLPTWAFDAATGAYTINGQGIQGFNPTLSVGLLSLVDIATLTLVKGSNFNGFAIAAPTEGSTDLVAIPCEPTPPVCDGITLVGVAPVVTHPLSSKILRRFTLAGAVAGTSPITSLVVESITQDEPHTKCCEPDGVITPTGGAIRPFKSAKALGRAYAVVVKATDAEGRTCSVTKTVTILKKGATGFVPFGPGRTTVFDSLAPGTCMPKLILVPRL